MTESLSFANKLKVLAILLVVGFVSFVNQYEILQFLDLYSQGYTLKPQTPNYSTNYSTDSQDIQERIQDPRPWLVVHVGPPKTGTTTIQNGLVSESVMGMLAQKDNIYYIGQFPPKLREHKYRNATIYTFPMSSMLQKSDKHNSDFRNEIEYHLNMDHNLLLSSEHYISKAKSMGHAMKTSFAMRSPKRRLQEDMKRKTHEVKKVERPEVNATDAIVESTAPFFGFRVKVVVAYRHFFQWLPSIHYQGYLVYKSNRTTPGLVHFLERFAGTYEGEDSERIFNQYEGQSGSLHGYEMWSGNDPFYDRIEIIDLHQQKFYKNGTTHNENSGSLLADFVCQSLPTATETCQFLLDDLSSEISKFNKASRVSNSKNDRMLPADKYRIIDEAIRRGMSEFQADLGDKEIKKQNAQIRRTLIKKMEKWFDMTYQNSTAAKEAIPKLCPGEKTLQALRKLSLDNLWEITKLVRKHSLSRQSKLSSPKGSGDASANHPLNYNNFRNYDEDMFRSSVSKEDLLLSREYSLDEEFSRDTSWWKATEVEHNAGFDAYVAKKKFCEVDIERMFEIEGFVKHVFGSDT